MGKIKEIFFLIIIPLGALAGWIFSLVSKNNALQDKVGLLKAKTEMEKHWNAAKKAEQDATDRTTDYERWKAEYLERTRPKE